MEQPHLFPDPSSHRSTRAAQRSWEDRYLELVAYKRATGEPNPPAKIGGRLQSLGQWLNDQRHRRRRGKLDPRKEGLLTTLGVVWEPGEDSGSVYLDGQFWLPLTQEIQGQEEAHRTSSWTPEEVEILHLNLLERSLQDLRDGRVASSTCQEILAWVMEEEDLPEAPPRGFSFRACSLLAGYDPRRLRDTLLDEVGVDPETVAPIRTPSQGDASPGKPADAGV